MPANQFNIADTKNPDDLDAYDYQLAREADEDLDSKTISFHDVLLRCGLSYADLQNQVQEAS